MKKKIISFSISFHRSRSHLLRLPHAYNSFILFALFFLNNSSNLRTFTCICLIIDKFQAFFPDYLLCDAHINEGDARKQIKRNQKKHINKTKKFNLIIGFPIVYKCLFWCFCFFGGHESSIISWIRHTAAYVFHTCIYRAFVSSVHHYFNLIFIIRCEMLCIYF